VLDTSLELLSSINLPCLPKLLTTPSKPPPPQPHQKAHSLFCNCDCRPSDDNQHTSTAALQSYEGVCVCVCVCVMTPPSALVSQVLSSPNRILLLVCLFPVHESHDRGELSDTVPVSLLFGQVRLLGCVVQVSCHTIREDTIMVAWLGH
jgi:hypothetical protein